MQTGQVVGRIAIWTGIGAVVGGLIGLCIGAFAPEMYVNWFNAEYVERVGGVWLGLTLGASEGAGLGVLIGLASIVLPWLNRKTAAQIKVTASYDATTDTVKISNKSRVPLLVFGVWALREIDTCAMFTEPLLITEGSKEIKSPVWRNNAGEQIEAPRTGTIAVLANGPTMNS